MEKRAMSVKELADAWGCSSKHIYNMIDRGDLQAFTIGARRGTRISVEEVRRWEEANQRSATAAEVLPSAAPAERLLHGGGMRRLVSGGA